MSDLDQLTQSRLLLAMPGLQHGFTNLKVPKPAILELDARTATAQQVHKAELVWIEAFEKRAREADAVATFIPGLSVGVYSADCTPLLVAAMDQTTKRVYGVMAAHAGWRGTALGIAGKSFREFHRAASARIDAPSYVAAIGPCIGPASFEVGAEVVDAFPGALEQGQARFFREEGGKPKFLFDLPGENLRQLKAAAADLGVPLEIDALGLCTYSCPEIFPSYRRDREKAGRILSFLSFAE